MRKTNGEEGKSCTFLVMHTDKSLDDTRHPFTLKALKPRTEGRGLGTASEPPRDARVASRDCGWRRAHARAGVLSTSPNVAIRAQQHRRAAKSRMPRSWQEKAKPSLFTAVVAGQPVKKQQLKKHNNNNTIASGFRTFAGPEDA